MIFFLNNKNKMLFKYLEILKSIEEKDLKELLESSFNHFTSNRTNKINENIIESKVLKAGFSGLVRFFRCINANKKLEEDQINQLAKEIFKGKNAELNSILINQINSILSIQNKRINFTEVNLEALKNIKNSDNDSSNNYIAAKRQFLLNNIFEFKSFSWKIDINISNNISNRVLLPEILFMFSLEDGKTYSFLINVKVFQELRRLLTVHIKRIIENEQVILLK